PVYAIAVPSNVIVPEAASLAVDETEEWLPLMTSLSKPPAPPSILPLNEPPAATTNVSLLFALPVRLSNPLNETDPTVPELGPAIVHEVSALGPVSVFPVPPAETAETFENVTPAVPAPLTLPALRDRAGAAPRCRGLLPAAPSNG